MCTKTKTSYGCGHSFKTMNPCDDRSCKRAERYAFIKEGDCKNCRSGGDNVTRGLDGEGRYGRKLHRSSESPRSKRSDPTSSMDISGGAGPWTPDRRDDSIKNTSTRKQADNAWVFEHENRIADLQERFDKYSMSSRGQSPRESYEQVVETADHHLMQALPPARTHRHQQTLPYEILNVEDDSDHSRGRRRGRRGSNDSMPQCHETTTIRHGNSKIQYVPTPISEFDYQRFTPNEKKTYRRTGPNTEPSYTRSHYYDSPLSSSPYPGAYWRDHYEVVQPLNYSYSFPRTSRVY